MERFEQNVHEEKKILPECYRTFFWYWKNSLLCYGTLF